MYTDAQLAAYRGRQIGYLFQQFELLDNLTGGENILLPAQIHKMPEKESRKMMQKLAEYFEIEEVLEKFPNQMSGGQKQRVAALSFFCIRRSYWQMSRPVRLTAEVHEV